MGLIVAFGAAVDNRRDAFSLPHTQGSVKLAKMPQREQSAGRHWREFAMAIVVGNLLYFSLLPYFPRRLRHEIFQLDLGLALDFLLCLASYLGLRRWVFSRWF